MQVTLVVVAVVLIMDGPQQVAETVQSQDKQAHWVKVEMVDLQRVIGEMINL